MNTHVGNARIGQWYQRWDKGEIFQVTGVDEVSGTIEIQSFGGDIDELDELTWRALPLTLAEPPEDWSGPVDVEVDDLGYSETEMTAADWAESLEPSTVVEAQVWQDSRDETERDPTGEGRPRDGRAGEEGTLSEW